MKDDRAIQLGWLRSDLKKKVTGSEEGRVENQMIEDLFAVTNVSRNTLKRIFLIETPPEGYFPQLGTRKLLINFLGYDDWAEYIDSKRKRFQPKVELEYETDFSELSPDIVLPNSPFKYLDAFSREDARIFFGRGRAIRKLLAYLNAPNSDQILLLYGQSGVGKSSFLNAGLLPRIEKKWTSHAIHIGKPLELPEARILSEQYRYPVIWVLDQAERLFYKDQQRTTENLSETIQFLKFLRLNRKMDRVIFSFRKEYLAEFDKALTRTGMNFKRYFLEPLDISEVREVINSLDSSESMTLKYEIKIALQAKQGIESLVLRDLDSPIAPTLQIVLSKLWEASINQGDWPPIITMELFATCFSVRGHILDDFIAESLSNLQSLNPSWNEGGLALDVLEFFVSPIATSLECDRAQVRERYRHIKDIDAIVHHLVAVHVLSESPKFQPGLIRLSHDALGPLIRMRFDESMLPGQMARRLIRSRMPSNSSEQLTKALFTRNEIALIDRGVPHSMTLSEKENVAVARSKMIHKQEDRRTNLMRIVLVGLAVSLLGLCVIAALLFNSGQEAHALNADQLYLKAKNELFRWENKTENALSIYQEVHEMGFHSDEIQEDLLKAVQEFAYHNYFNTFDSVVQFADRVIVSDSIRRLFFGEYAYLAIKAKDTSRTMNALNLLGDSGIENNKVALANYAHDFDGETQKWEARYFPEWVPVHYSDEDTAYLFLCSKREITNEDFALFLNLSMHSQDLFYKFSICKSSYGGPDFNQFGYSISDSIYPFMPIQVSWEGAKMYCDWFGFRIPSEKEWIAAAHNDWNTIQSLSGKIDSIILDRAPGLIWQHPDDRISAIDSLTWTQTSTANGDSPRTICMKYQPFFQFCDIFGNVSEWVTDEIYPDRENVHKKYKGGSFLNRKSMEIMTLKGSEHESPYKIIDVGFRPIKIP